MLRFTTTALLGVLLSSPLLAAETKTYQVTGPVLEVKEDAIVVDKNGEAWEVSKDATATMSGNVKKGDKVTIKYKMIATEVEVKPDTTKKKK